MLDEALELLHGFGGSSRVRPEVGLVAMPGFSKLGCVALSELVDRTGSDMVRGIEQVCGSEPVEGADMTVERGGGYVMWSAF